MTYQTATPLQIRTIDSNETVKLGSWNTMPAPVELKNIIVHMTKRGVASGNETLQLKIYPSGTPSGSTIASSEIVNLSDFSTSTDFIGWLKFDFNRENLNTNQGYHLFLETNNYTANGNTFYLSLVFDGPDPINLSAGTPHYYADYPKAFKIIGYQS